MQNPGAELCGHPSKGFLDETRLADPGIAHHGEQMRLSVLRDPSKDVEQQPEFALAPDQRCPQVTDASGLTRNRAPRPDCSECQDRFHLALDWKSPMRLIDNGPSSQVLS